MAKILLSTNHPAPYINRWIEVLKQKHEVCTAYYYEKSLSKKWKEFTPIKGKIITNNGFLDFCRAIKRSDISIIGGWNKPYYIGAVLYGNLFRKKLYLFSDFPDDNSNSKIKHALKKIVFRKLFSGVMGATHSTCNYYREKYGVKQCIPFPYLGIPTPTYSKVYPNTTDKLKIFIANNFMRRKGYSIVFETFKILKEDKILDKFEIIIAGDGEEFGKYQSLIMALDANIKLLGWVENSDYEKYMENTDIFIHASLFEPFGIPPIDAMKRGLVLIASEGVKSVNGIIDNGVNGFIYPSNSAVELASILKYICRNPNIMKGIGKKARNTAIEQYGEDSILTAINTLSKL